MSSGRQNQKFVREERAEHREISVKAEQDTEEVGHPATKPKVRAEDSACKLRKTHVPSNSQQNYKKHKSKTISSAALIRCSVCRPPAVSNITTRYPKTNNLCSLHPAGDSLPLGHRIQGLFSIRTRTLLAAYCTSPIAAGKVRTRRATP